MGACNIQFTIDKQATTQEVLAAFKRQREIDNDANGHQEGYSGDFQTVDTVKCEFKETFPSYNEAMEYCLKKAEKFCYAIAVHYVDKKNNIKTLIAGWGAC